MATLGSLIVERDTWKVRRPHWGDRYLAAEAAPNEEGESSFHMFNGEGKAVMFPWGDIDADATDWEIVE
jgi:hypothetical protein